MDRRGTGLANGKIGSAEELDVEEAMRILALGRSGRGAAGEARREIQHVLDLVEREQIGVGEQPGEELAEGRHALGGLRFGGGEKALQGREGRRREAREQSS